MRSIYKLKLVALMRSSKAVVVLIKLNNFIDINISKLILILMVDLPIEVWEKIIIFAFDPLKRG